MLRHLADNYINKYDWFVRLDDDAFISWPILEKLLRRLDPSQPLYIGEFFGSWNPIITHFAGELMFCRSHLNVFQIIEVYFNHQLGLINFILEPAELNFKLEFGVSKISLHKNPKRPESIIFQVPKDFRNNFDQFCMCPRFIA